jgi:hypothetical protein
VEPVISVRLITGSIALMPFWNSFVTNTKINIIKKLKNVSFAILPVKKRSFAATAY